MTGASLAGKTALVTGAGRGIGRAIALRLAEQGALVAVHYGSSAAAADETVSAIEAKGGCAFALQADLRSLAAIEALFAALDQRLEGHGAAGLDILVNNAGLGIMATISETDEDAYDRQFDVNAKAMFFLTQKALTRLRDGGRIVNLSSMVSIPAYPACIAYAMTKASVNAFTRSLAAELGPRGITVNAVAPGATRTDMLAPLERIEGFTEAIKAQTALGRAGEADDIADVVAFLASPAGRWVTGQIIQASGGMHL